MKRLLFLGLAVIVSLGGFGAMAQDAEGPVVDVYEHPEHGPILIAASGRTLYQFTQDEEGVSNCFDDCAEVWLPFQADEPLELPEGVEGELTIIERGEGTGVAAEDEDPGHSGEAEGEGTGPGDMTVGEATAQVAYNGIPLYYYVEDTAAGDVNGHGVDDAWFIVAPGQQFGEVGQSPNATPEATPDATPGS